MSFKHPEILYSLFLLLIPVIIHLVRWKKFKKRLFTNLAFLQELEIKSRKSRKLKEWLVLFLRLSAFTFLIFAFAQWFKPSQASLQNLENDARLVYIDNSLSMTAMQGKTNLWQMYLQEFSKSLPQEQSYILLTNDKVYENVSGKNLIKIIYDLPFSNRSVRHRDVLNKIKLLLKKKSSKKAQIIYASDMQNVYNEQLNDSLFTPDYNYYFLTKHIENLPDISVDSLWLVEKNNETYHLKLQLSATNTALNTAVDIVRDKEVLWHSTIDFKDDLDKTLDITLPLKKNIEAVVRINDKGFLFDNRLYFTLHQPEKLNILLVGEHLPDFLDKIYSKDEFNVQKVRPGEINYAVLNDFDFIILYHIQDAGILSATAFRQFVKQYGNLLLIPSDNRPELLQQLLSVFRISARVDVDTSRVYLNKIHYEHPFFQGVFLKKVYNFAYPSVRIHYQLTPQGEWLYALNDQSAFASVYHRNGNIYLINNSLDETITNFVQAPSLLVPLFYQMAITGNKPQQLYYINGINNSCRLKVKIGQDDILTFEGAKERFIPQQTNRYNSVELNCQNKPQFAGLYNVSAGKQKISAFAFNQNRKEKILQFVKIPESGNLKSIDSLEKLIEQQKQLQKEKPLWKWLLVLALLSLVLEMLVIKYWK